MQDRHAQVALDELLGVGLLQVQVQVTQRARRDDAVGARVDRVGHVAARLAQRRRPVHRDHREAAALVRARVGDRPRRRPPRSPSRGSGRGPGAARSPAAGSGGRCSSRRTARPAGRRAAARPARAGGRGRCPRPAARGSSCSPSPCPSRSAGPSGLEVRVDVLAVGVVGVQPLLALRLRALAGRADVHHRRRAVDRLGDRERAGVERVRRAPGCARRSRRRRSSSRGRARPSRCRASARPSPSSRAARA